MHPATRSFALVLGGGNALGAYQAGVYQALDEARQRPDWIAGTSVGAVNGAVIAGNAEDVRVARLRDLWQPSAISDGLDWPSGGETLRRTAAVAATMIAGRPGLFAPVGPLGSWWRPDPLAAAPGLFDQAAMSDTLARLVDPDRLNGGTPRYTACAVDLTTGEDRFFDSTEGRVAIAHIRASAALMPTFPPVDVDGRLLVDGGVSANVPLDAVLRSPGDGPRFCLAVDLMPVRGGRPHGLGEAAGRAQDLLFAVQTRRAIDHWRHVYAHDPAYAGRSVTLARLAYRDQEREVAGKAMDFSPETIRQRWDAGRRDAAALLDRLAAGALPIGAPGLTVIGNEDQPSD